MKPWKLTLKSRVFPTFDDARIATAPVSYISEADEYGIERAAYYISGDDYEIKTLDAEFYLREFLEVNPNDPDEMCAFMSRNGFIKQNSFAVDFAKAPNDQRLRTWESPQKRIDGFAWANNKLGSRTWSLAEDAARVLADAQRIVTTCIRAHHEGLLTEGEFADTSLSTINYIKQEFDWVTDEVSRYYPIAEIDEAACAQESPAAYVAQRPVMSLIPAVFTQLLVGLTSDVGYKQCLNCGQWFMYKRNSNGISSRDPRSKYCSDECQRRANHIKDNIRQREARRAAKAQEGIAND